MFDLSVLNGLETVGSFIVYKDTFAFVIGPDQTGERLGVMRLGGHIEGNESYLQALKREIKEEGSIGVKFISSPNTFYKRNWNDDNYSEVTDDIDLDIKPLIIVGDKTRSTAVFLSYAEEEPKPSSEIYGIIFLKENEIKRICSEKLKLKDLLEGGVRLIEQKNIDYDMEVYAGVHLTFLNKLMEDKNDLVKLFVKKNVL